MFSAYLSSILSILGLAIAAFPPGAPTIQEPVTEAATYVQLINLVPDVRYAAVIDVVTDACISKF